MRKELLSAVVIFGLGAGVAWAQEATDSTNPTVVPPAEGTQAGDASQTAPANDGTAGTSTDAAQTTTTTGTTSGTTDTTGTGTSDTAGTTGTVAPTTDTTGTAQTTTDTTGTAGTADDSEAVATTTEDGETVQEVANDHLLGSDFMGADVVQSDGTSIGEISDVVIDPETYVIKNVVIDIGGFLGIGTKTVTLPVEDLTGPNEDGDLQVGMTREQIETLPDFVGMPDDTDQVPAMSDPAVTDTTGATTDTTGTGQ